jgi:hypothetical protein
VIVRIAAEGQYEVGDSDTPKLRELDDAAAAACDAGNADRFRETFEQLLAFVRSTGRSVPGDELVGSDMILPPPDVTFEEACAEFSGEGLLPNT